MEDASGTDAVATRAAAPTCNISQCMNKTHTTKKHMQKQDSAPANGNRLQQHHGQLSAVPADLGFSVRFHPAALSDALVIHDVIDVG